MPWRRRRRVDIVSRTIPPGSSSSSTAAPVTRRTTPRPARREGPVQGAPEDVRGTPMVEDEAPRKTAKRTTKKAGGAATTPPRPFRVVHGGVKAIAIGAG